MSLNVILGRGLRKAPLLEFHALSLLQGRKVGISLYSQPTSAAISLKELFALAHQASAECLMQMDTGAPQMPDANLDTESLGRICVACIDQMLASSKSGLLAHQEKEWLNHVFSSLPALSQEEREELVGSMRWPAGKEASEAVRKRFGYELEKAKVGLRAKKGLTVLQFIVQRQESTLSALRQASQIPRLNPPKIQTVRA